MRHKNACVGLALIRRMSSILWKRCGKVSPPRVAHEVSQRLVSMQRRSGAKKKTNRSSALPWRLWEPEKARGVISKSD
jgi:hypothetical protein